MSAPARRASWARRSRASVVQPLGHDVGMRRQPVIGQAVPGREDQHLALGREEAQPVLQPLQPLAVARHVQDVLPAGGARQLGQRQRIGALRQAGDGPAAGLAVQIGGRRLGKRSPLEPHAKRQSLRSTGVSASGGDCRPGRRPSRRCRCRLPASRRSYWSSSAAIELGDMGARELAKENVVLLVAAIDAAIEQTLAPRLEIRLACHVFPRSGPKGA